MIDDTICRLADQITRLQKEIEVREDIAYERGFKDGKNFGMERLMEYMSLKAAPPVIEIKCTCTENEVDEIWKKIKALCHATDAKSEE